MFPKLPPTARPGLVAVSNLPLGQPASGARFDLFSIYDCVGVLRGIVADEVRPRGPIVRRCEVSRHERGLDCALGLWSGVEAKTPVEPTVPHPYCRNVAGQFHQWRFDRPRYAHDVPGGATSRGGPVPEFWWHAVRSRLGHARTRDPEGSDALTQHYVCGGDCEHSRHDGGPDPGRIEPDACRTVPGHDARADCSRHALYDFCQLVSDGPVCILLAPDFEARATRQKSQTKLGTLDSMGLGVRVWRHRKCSHGSETRIHGRVVDDSNRIQDKLSCSSGPKGIRQWRRCPLAGDGPRQALWGRERRRREQIPVLRFLSGH
mmetsp:Transcript_24645/g.68042  ORF Transcript_24645/g.68042 Transcript_24645/m.68042 type:complete len:319 (-) Transcript_24645:750-1706(-)